MTRHPLTGWTVAGVLLAMLIGTVHAFAESQLSNGRHAFGNLFPRGWFE